VPTFPCRNDAGARKERLSSPPHGGGGKAHAGKEIQGRVLQRQVRDSFHSNGESQQAVSPSKLLRETAEFLS